MCFDISYPAWAPHDSGSWADWAAALATLFVASLAVNATRRDAKKRRKAAAGLLISIIKPTIEAIKPVLQQFGATGNAATLKNMVEQTLPFLNSVKEQIARHSADVALLPGDCSGAIADFERQIAILIYQATGPYVVGRGQTVSTDAAVKAAYVGLSEIAQKAVEQLELEQKKAVKNG